MMPQSSGGALLRVRVFSAVACILAAALALGVRFGLHDGDWILFVPSIAAGLPVLYPVKAAVWLAIACTTAILLLGLASVGLFFGPSLAALIAALDVLDSRADRATA